MANTGNKMGLTGLEIQRLIDGGHEKRLVKEGAIPGWQAYGVKYKGGIRERTKFGHVTTHGEANMWESAVFSNPEFVEFSVCRVTPNQQ
jgi:hypothetical protein